MVMGRALILSQYNSEGDTLYRTSLLERNYLLFLYNTIK